MKVTHYEIVTFYRRSHVVKAKTEAEALRKLAARALTTKTESYSQLWACDSEKDHSEQIAFFENGEKARLIAAPSKRAILTKH